MPFSDNPLFRRLRQHAQKRLVFDPGVPRSKQLPAYKQYLKLENEMLKRYHRKGDSGRRVCAARAAVIDVIIENLFLAALDLYATEHGTIPAKMSILATGGYGRGELCPHSDIDVMLLYPDRIKKANFAPFQEILTVEILYPLWDLGLKVGHASRNTEEVIAECKREIQSKNAMLESRLICGSNSLYQRFRRGFERYVRRDNPQEYIRQRVKDQAERHAKYGDTPYLQEPNIKNGVGGLRDYQNILWLANLKFGYQSFEALEKKRLLRSEQRRAMEHAYSFLLRVRNELHFQSRRPEDKLDLETQTRVAENLGYPGNDIFQRVEGFMKDYYRAARTIYLTSQLLDERLALIDPRGKGGRISFMEALRAHQFHAQKRIDGFLIIDDVLRASSTTVFDEDPERLIRVFRHMQQFGVRLDPDLTFLIHSSKHRIDSRVIHSESAARSFRAILQSAGEVHATLLKMHDLGVLGRYLPEFGQLTCLVQHEYYHRYTADVHVLNTIRELDRVFQNEAEEVKKYEAALRQNDTPTLLYLILLLHDIGKAEGIRGHAKSGARIAGPILERLKVDGDDREQILFIIESHLEMARIWQRYDLDDPRTAENFAQFTGDPERLRFLYVHTYCDARGTAPTLWNGYKDAMHTLLYKRALELFGDREALHKKRRERRAMLLKDLKSQALEGISPEEIEAHFNLLPERYFINTQPQEVELHLRMVNQLLNNIQEAESVGSLAPVVEWNDDVSQGMTVVNVVTWDRSGLFSKIAGALSAAGANILSTRAISRSDHISIDTFYIIDPDGGTIQDPKAREVFMKCLRDALVEDRDLLPQIIERERKQASAIKKRLGKRLPAPFPPSVDVYHELSLKRTIIEVRAEDRIGLLYRLSRLITRSGFDITFARIATERGVAMDTFYIENPANKELASTSRLMELREALNKAVREHA